MVELLDGLPVDQREAVRARVIDDLDYEQVASIARVSPAAARKRVSRGLATLRRQFEQRGGPDDFAA
ncbi:MAG: RNA polymerase sigma factor [Trebonia sp.]